MLLRLVPVLLFLLLPGVQGQTPESRITLELQVPANSTTGAGNTTLVPVEVTATFAGMYCTGPGTLEVALDMVSDGNVQGVEVSGPSTISIPFRTGPVSNSPAGPAPGLPSPSTAMDNVTITVSRAAKDAALNLSLTATFGGTLPAGCQGPPAEPAEALAKHSASVVAKPVESASTKSSAPAASDASKDAPFPSFVLLLLALLVVARRR